ncbi:MAG: hypothetical protein QOJ16_3140 [Acidobacteriota bacterium]|jgi:hypothetical protein|nr:hypothetical protein [Acidobacteriota bacterium]
MLSPSPQFPESNPRKRFKIDALHSLSLASFPAVRYDGAKKEWKAR